MASQVKHDVVPTAAEKRSAQSMFPNNKKEFTVLGPSSSLGELRQRRKFGMDVDYREVASIQPCNTQILNKRLNTFKKDSFDRNNPVDREQFSKIIKATHRNDDRWKELADYKMFELRNDVMATPFALAAFQAVNLSADELPAVLHPRPRNLQRFTVRSIGNDGGARQDQWRTYREMDQYEMDLLSSDRVEYPIRDIQQGNIPEIDDVSTELEYDIEMKIDALALNNIKAAKTVSGLKSLLRIHPSIDPANIPDTNYIDLSGANAGVLTIDKLKSILKLVLLWSTVGTDVEPLSISSMFMSPQNLRDSWDFVDLVTAFNDGAATVRPVNTIPDGMRDDIYATGMFASAWGQKFNWVPNNQISLGRMYITYSQPLGWYVTKSEFDQMIRWETADHVEQNIGEILYQRCLQFIVPNLWLYRILIVDF